FPRGLLREPPSHLRRAGCIIVTNADRVDSQALDALRNQIDRLAGTTPLLTAVYAVQVLRPLGGSNPLPAAWLQDRKVATFCALANPESFEDQVRRGGAAIVHSARLPDHAEPTMSDLNSFIETACS